MDNRCDVILDIGEGMRKERHSRNENLLFSKNDMMIHGSRQTAATVLLLLTTQIDYVISGRGFFLISFVGILSERKCVVIHPPFSVHSHPFRVSCSSSFRALLYLKLSPPSKDQILDFNPLLQYRFS